MDPLKIALHELGGALTAYRKVMHILRSGEDAQLRGASGSSGSFLDSTRY